MRNMSVLEMIEDLNRGGGIVYEPSQAVIDSQADPDRQFVCWVCGGSIIAGKHYTPEETVARVVGSIAS